VFNRTRRRYGGHIAHQGVAMAVIAMALSKSYKVEHDVTLNAGESSTIGSFTATFREAAFKDEGNRKALEAVFTATDGGADIGELKPRLNYYATQREPIYTPTVYSSWTKDLYLSVIELDREGKYVVVRMIVMPGIFWLWVSAVVIAVGSIIVMLPDRRVEKRLVPDAATEAA